jgi:hypothetical protein
LLWHKNVYGCSHGYQKVGLTFPSTPWSRMNVKLIVSHLLMEVSAVYGTRYCWQFLGVRHSALSMPSPPGVMSSHFLTKGLCTCLISFFDHIFCTLYNIQSPRYVILSILFLSFHLGPHIFFSISICISILNTIECYSALTERVIIPI